MGQLEQFLSDISPNGDWQPLIDYINQNYVRKEVVEDLRKNNNLAEQIKEGNIPQTIIIPAEIFDKNKELIMVNLFYKLDKFRKWR